MARISGATIGKYGTGAKAIFVALALVAVVVVTLYLVGPRIQRSIFYPKPGKLPPVVDETTEQLLAKLQAVLETNAPTVLRALQPGLSDSQIAALETQGAFRLSDDLRAFYRWRNGSATNAIAGLLAGQRFVPLEEVVRERFAGQQIGSAPLPQRAAFFVFASHRRGWLTVLNDGAGDGYFYDPKRTDTEGAFFHHFAEASYYVWFPSFRNFLAGVIACYESGAMKMSADGESLDENFERTQEVWERFGKNSDGDG